MSVAIDEAARRGGIGKSTRHQLIDTAPPAHGSSASGRVYLIGAGPGDPELITLKGLRYLRAADVVVYDRLISLSLLDEVRPEAERVFVGKEPGCHSMKQEEINSLLIKYARQGHLVVRLKGGDPFIFGRGGEEALALAHAGIPFEIVPGVSSAIAVPAYAGIPVTHRGYSSSVTIVTGHEDPTHASSTVNWETLARLDSTLVILMGIAALPSITRQLLHGGLHPGTPAAVIQQGTVPQQRVVTDTLANIAEHAKTARITSPAVVVIGEVAALSDSLAWFDVPHSGVTTPHGSKPGASGMTLVCRPTPIVRFMHRSETSSKQLLYRMARLIKTAVFLPMTLRHGSHRNTI